MRFRNRRGASHVSEYERIADGRLKLGTPCFSGPVLKKRFESEDEAIQWTVDNPKIKMYVYECFMCGGWHMTGKKK